MTPLEVRDLRCALALGCLRTGRLVRERFPRLAVVAEILEGAAIREAIRCDLEAHIEQAAEFDAALRVFRAAQANGTGSLPPASKPN